MNDQTNLLTIQQAAKFLNVSETSLRRWTNEGRLACLRLGKKKVRRFRQADLLAFLLDQPLRDGATGDGDARSIDVDGIPLKHGTHICSFYTSDVGRIRLANNFLDGGMNDNCVCFLISTPETTQQTLNHMKKTRSGYQKDIDSGRLIISEYQDSGPLQLQKLETSFAACIKSGAHSLRLVGNVSEGNMAKVNSLEHVLEYERNYQRLLSKKFPLVTLCQYDARHQTGNEMVEILKCHHDVLSYPSDRLFA